jgi:hypothetical protein
MEGEDKDKARRTRHIGRQADLDMINGNRRSPGRHIYRHDRLCRLGGAVDQAMMMVGAVATDGEDMVWGRKVLVGILMAVLGKEESSIMDRI